MRTLSDRRHDAVICTIGAGPHQVFLDLSLPSMREYARRTGWDLAAVRRSLCPSRPAPWSKIVLIRRLLESHELVLWIDCDAVVLQPDRDIREILRPDRDVYMIEHRYDGLRVPNTGVVLVRRSPAALALLDAVWEQEDLIEHPWWENAALMRVMGYEIPPTGPVSESPFRDVVAFVGTEWNSVHKDSAEDPVIRHYAGLPTDWRLAGLTGDAALLRRRRTLAGAISGGLTRIRRRPDGGR